MKLRTKIVLGGALLFIGIGAAANSGSTPTAKAPVKATVLSSTTTVDPSQTWLEQNINVFQSLAHDFANIGTQITADQPSGNYASASAACATLGSDAKADQALGPIPNPALELQWSQILTNVNQISADCVQGIANTDVNQIDQAAALMTTATGEMNTLNSAITQG